MSERYLFPLERALRSKAENRDESPDHRDDLFVRYQAILSYLETNVYRFIDAGLASLSEENGLYTLHNKDHFDEVVKYAGELLGCTNESANFTHLSAYELFILLVAIRLHDAGNMYGRENHERQAYNIFLKMGDAVGRDRIEKSFIAEIAQAHGGRAADGSKDTIGQLEWNISYRNLHIRARVIAALVRFADEICESQNRAANVLLEDGKVKGENEVFHKYASCITSVTVVPTATVNPTTLVEKGCPKEIVLEFNIDAEDCARKWGKTQDGRLVEVDLIEEIFLRLEKMFREREYCVKYMREICNVVLIKAIINVWRDVQREGIVIRELVWSRVFTSEEEGYPENIRSISERYGVTGETLRQFLQGSSQSV